MNFYSSMLISDWEVMNMVATIRAELRGACATATSARDMLVKIEAIIAERGGEITSFHWSPKHRHASLFGCGGDEHYGIMASAELK